MVAANRAKAVVFLDGVAASYKKLHSLSATWRSKGESTEEGSFSWRHSQPVQLRFENKTSHILFISNGILTREMRGKGGEEGALDDVSPAMKDGSDLEKIECDDVTSFLLQGHNLLRTRKWSRGDGSSAQGEARLLGVTAVNGVRCRGVELTEYVEASDAYYTNVDTLWFDSHNLLRRYQCRHEGSAADPSVTVVDFQVRPNVKLAPSLFHIPKRT